MGSCHLKKKAVTTANLHKLRKIYGITCAVSGCVGKCDELGGTYGAHEFEQCPVASLQTRRWGVILELYGALRVSPLAQWPEGWAPWVVRGLSDLKGEIETAQSAATEEAYRNAG